MSSSSLDLWCASKRLRWAIGDNQAAIDLLESHLIALQQQQSHLPTPPPPPKPSSSFSPELWRALEQFSKAIADVRAAIDRADLLGSYVTALLRQQQQPHLPTPPLPKLSLPPVLTMDEKTMTYLADALELMMRIPSLMRIPNNETECALQCKQLASACRLILDGDETLYREIAFTVLGKWDEYTEEGTLLP